MAVFNIPPAPSVPLLQGVQQPISPVWYSFFFNLFNSVGGGQSPITLGQLITDFVDQRLSLVMPSWLTVTGSPVGGNTGILGTLTIASASEAANLFLASPSGGAGVLSPRAIATIDLASVLLGPAQGGTGINNGTDTLTLGVPLTLTGTGTPTLNVGAGGTLGAYAFLTAGQVTNSLGSDVPMDNTANYFTGPSAGNGTTGTWFASGSVTCSDTASGATFYAKLWDGMTVIASGAGVTAAANDPVTIALSGYLTTPAANLRISVRDITAVTGLILSNATGSSKDSTVSAFRIA